MRAYDKVIRVVKRISMLESVKEVLLWDQKTMMPSDSSILRSGELVAITTAIHRNITSHFLKNISKAKKEELTNLEQKNINEIHKKYFRLKKVRQSTITKIEETKVIARTKWNEAREKNNFTHINKPFKKILDLQKAYAHAINNKKETYETILENYEPDFTVEEINQLFDEVKPELIKIRKEMQTQTSTFESKIVKRTEQKKLITFILERIGYNLNKGRIDFAERAFSGANGRIVIRKNATWLSNIFTALHEAGHSMHTHNLPEKFIGTPLGSEGTYSLRESQALIWQNYIGKEKSFWEYFYPQLKETYGLPFNIETFIEIINSKRQLPTRIGSDRANYGLHIILRFELEQKFFDDKITPAKLKNEWNKKYKEMFGTEKDSLLKNGFLQDIHWFVGSTGYFPAYLLGEMIAAQLYHKMKGEIKEFNNKLKKGQFEEVHDWLANKIHSTGRKLSTKELLETVTGEKLNSKYYIESIKSNYQAK